MHFNLYVAALVAHFYRDKMNLASISQFVVGIYPYQDYNETMYCLKNAVRNNELERCTKISGFSTFNYFPLFVFQVSFPRKKQVLTFK
jgi:hypothetical protein